MFRPSDSVPGSRNKTLMEFFEKRGVRSSRVTCVPVSQLTFVANQQPVSYRHTPSCNHKFLIRLYSNICHQQFLK